MQQRERKATSVTYRSGCMTSLLLDAACSAMRRPLMRNRMSPEEE
jgi:hypothetical protein